MTATHVVLLVPVRMAATSTRSLMTLAASRHDGLTVYSHGTAVMPCVPEGALQRRRAQATLWTESAKIFGSITK